MTPIRATLTGAVQSDPGRLPPCMRLFTEGKILHYVVLASLAST